ncbi:hemolysin family protein [Curtobacterium sp. ISL-83]|uniref:hemolysin family protein n=1 Tax=Curtobacterium sp. ISL-83 TaxID=2819145 RepID=UPI001BE7088E|nr:hemolysin family protein [Curtobacterium sp. ISL-83]MBT2503701.1 HlyC/CorC family transporter [Curtobacterium sp. ISL-83]
MLVGGILLTLGTGVFVASEFALVNLDRADVEARRDRGETGLAPVIAALKVTSTHLSSAQLGITLTTLLTGYLLEPSIAKLLEAPFLALDMPEGVIETVGSIVALVIATLLSMILGELVPKNFALALPLQTARLVVPVQVAFTMVFKPAVRVLNGTANAVLRSLGIEPQEELSGARSAEELTSLLRRSASEGSLEQDTATLLQRTISFSELSASDVMTPRPRLSTIRVSESADDVIALARRTGFSRFPVIEEDADDVVGLVHVKQAVAVPREKRRDVPVGALMTDAERVPETMPGDTLLAEVRSRGYQMVIVVDEYGGTAGVVTLEDLVEELVGEVSDEHDRARIDVVRSRNWLTFPGLLRPDELEDRAGVRVPEEGPYETVGGFIMSTLGRLPSVGDEVAMDDGVFRVERLDGRRVDRIRWTPTPSATEPGSAGAGSVGAGSASGGPATGSTATTGSNPTTNSSPVTGIIIPATKGGSR